jgi:hypothetical protein
MRERNKSMSDEVGSKSQCASAGVAELHARESPETIVRADFTRLPADEIERLIALCEAPALLWCRDPAPAREPEPFGMIA